MLDLFAGTGAFGLEALSRGARSVVFIDSSSQSISVLRENLAGLHHDSPTQVIQWDLSRNLNCLNSSEPDIDLVFMDPPYNKNLIRPTLGHLHRSQCLADNARIIVEHSRQEAVFADQLPFEIVDRRKYGKTLVTFFEYMV